MRATFFQNEKIIISSSCDCFFSVSALANDRNELNVDSKNVKVKVLNDDTTLE